MQLNVNGTARDVDAPGEMPLLWVIRDVLGLTGTKFGCGMALCGACTVHLDGEAVRSCVMPVRRAGGKKVGAIEGLSPGPPHPPHGGWGEGGVPPGGDCPAGADPCAGALPRGDPEA